MRKDSLLHNHSLNCQWNTHTLTFGGGPYDTQEYNTAAHLGSAHFDGNGDYLTYAATSLDLGQLLLENVFIPFNKGGGSYRYGMEALGMIEWKLCIY